MHTSNADDPMANKLQYEMLALTSADYVREVGADRYNEKKLWLSYHCGGSIKKEKPVGDLIKRIAFGGMIACLWHISEATEKCAIVNYMLSCLICK